MIFPLSNIIALLFLIICFKADKGTEPAYMQELPGKPMPLDLVQINPQSIGFVPVDTLFSGWNTLIYENRSPEIHFAKLNTYPNVKYIENTGVDVLPPLKKGMNLIMAENIENAAMSLKKLAKWFNTDYFKGGTGLISPRHTAISTIYLEPGPYSMECYVKSFDGDRFTPHGTIKQFIVKDEASNMEPPNPTIVLDISSTNGIILHGSIRAGKNIFQTNFLDQKLYEHFVGHDVNLVRNENSAPLDPLIRWMNRMNPRGLTTPPPLGFTFLGGMNHLSGGKKGFFEANLEPGDYVLISEVPDATKKKLIHSFTIRH